MNKKTEQKISEKIKKQFKTTERFGTLTIVGWIVYIIIILSIEPFSVESFSEWFNYSGNGFCYAIFSLSLVIYTLILSVLTYHTIDRMYNGFHKVIPSMDAEQVEDLKSIIKKHFTKHRVNYSDFVEYFTTNSLEKVKTRNELKLFFIDKYNNERKNSNRFDNITTKKYKQIVDEIVNEFVDKYILIYGGM